MNMGFKNSGWQPIEKLSEDTNGSLPQDKISGHHLNINCDPNACRSEEQVRSFPHMNSLNTGAAGVAHFFAEIGGANFYGAAHFVETRAHAGADAIG